MKSIPEKIGAIIVTFNNVCHTLCAVESLLNSKAENVEALVVDNGSDTAYLRILQDEVKKKFPRAVELLCLEKAGGYGYACNKGAQLLKGKGCDTLFFLNNDISIDEECILHLRENLKTEQIAAVGPKVYRGFSNTIQSAGGFFNRRLTFVQNRGSNEVDRGQYDTRQEVEFINGCAFMISEKVFTEVNGFDEKFYYYNEEADLCYRIMKKGYKLIYEPRAVVHHWPSSTFGTESKMALYYRTRSQLQFVKKHTNSKYILFYNFLDIFHHFVLKFTCHKVCYILARAIAVFNGMKHFMIGKTDKGPYG